MIPTRLGQQLHNGTVLGFNRKLGSIVIAYNQDYHVSCVKINPLLPLVNQIRVCEPIEYVWPFVSDLETVLYHVYSPYENVNRYRHLKWDHLNITFGRYYNTGEIVCENGSVMLRQMQLLRSKNEVKHNLLTFIGSLTSGYVIPVTRISGRNCDTC